MGLRPSDNYFKHRKSGISRVRDSLSLKEAQRKLKSLRWLGLSTRYPDRNWNVFSLP